MTRRIAALFTVILSLPLLAATEVDLSTPQAAAKSLYNAVQAQDGPAIKEILYGSTDVEKDLCASFADLLVAGKRLESAVKSRYGAGAGSISPGVMGKDELTKIEQGKTELDGDSAQLIPAGRARPLKFKRVNGQWKLIVADYAGGTAANLPRQLETIRSMDRVIDAAATDVADGKYQSAAEAEAAIQQKLYDVIITAVQKNPPASAPSTSAPSASGPSTRP